MNLVQGHAVALLQHHEHATTGSRGERLARANMLAHEIARMLERRVRAHEDVALHMLAVEEDRQRVGLPAAQPLGDEAADTVLANVELAFKKRSKSIRRVLDERGALVRDPRYGKGAAVKCCGPWVDREHQSQVHRVLHRASSHRAR